VADTRKNYKTNNNGDNLMVLGTKQEVVNANKFKIFFGAAGTDQYILATRKEFIHRAPQKRLATDAGPVYFTMLSNDQLLLTIAYTTGEVGNSVPSNWDEMLQRNSLSGEVPKNAFRIEATDRQNTPVTKTHQLNCKCEELRVFGNAEGEVLASLVLRIIDTEPSVF